MDAIRNILVEVGRDYLIWIFCPHLDNFVGQTGVAFVFHIELAEMSVCGFFASRIET